MTDSRDGSNVASMDIDVFDANGLSVTVTGGRTAVDGFYTVILPGPGTYRLRADASVGDGLADQYFGNQLLLSQATPIVVGAGQNVTDINLSLVPGVTVSGQVSAAGTPLEAIDIDVYALNGEFLSGYPGLTDAGGNYTVGALPPGSYYIRANPDPAAGQSYTTVYLGGALSLGSAVPLAVGAAPLSGRNIAVQEGAAISGRITEQGTGAPLGGLDIDLYTSAGNRVDVNASSRLDGTYSLPLVPSGGYQIRVDPTIAEGYPRTWYPAANNRAASTILTVGANAPATGIDFVLGRAGSISGIMRAADNASPAVGIDLDCYDSTDTRIDLTTVTAADGTYIIGPMAPGTYHLRADPTLNQGFALQYYSGAPDILTATDVTVVANANTPNVDFNLTRAGWIEGTVVAAGGGLPLAGIDLDLYLAGDGTRVTLSAATGADGRYSIGPIPVGDYKLRCDPTVAQGFAVEYWDAKSRLFIADAIPVTAGAGALGRNFSLDPGASISGRITDEATGLGLGGIDIDVLSVSPLARFDQSAKTAADGTYTIGPFAAGSYYLRADAPNASPYLDEYYPSASDPVGATPIVINPGANVGGINLQLSTLQNPSTSWVIW